MRPDGEFAPLRIVRKCVTDFDRSTYRVYKSPDEYVTVEAATALEAFRESGIRNPYRILRETRFMERLLDYNRFSDAEEIIETGLFMESSHPITQQRESMTTVAAISSPAVQPQQEQALHAQVNPSVSDVPPSVSTPVAATVNDATEPQVLSEEAIEQLLGAPQPIGTPLQQEQAVTTPVSTDSELSPEDVMRLLDGDGNS